LISPQEDAKGRCLRSRRKELVMLASQQEGNRPRADEEHEQQYTAYPGSPPQPWRSSPQSARGSTTTLSPCIKVGDFDVILMAAVRLLAFAHLCFSNTSLAWRLDLVGAP
jgi:hypothetical protein